MTTAAAPTPTGPAPAGPHSSLGPLEQVDAGVLSVGYAEAGPRAQRRVLRQPDHVAVVIHDYRWRLGHAEGEPQFDDLERRLAEAPAITVPTISLEGDANGAPHSEPGAYAATFTGTYMHRTVTDGIGHNLPQEAPQAFADAVVEVDGW